MAKRAFEIPEFDSLWVEKWRPTTLDDLLLSQSNRDYFNNVSENQLNIPHLIFAGPNGIGKSSLAKILVNDVLECIYLYINASDESGIDVIREKITKFARTKSFDGKIKVVILDEADGLSGTDNKKGTTSAQKALRNLIEEHAKTTRFILTCNFPKNIITALHSRCQSFDLTPSYEDCIERCEKILEAENITVSEETKPKLAEYVKVHYPDLRVIIGGLQKNSFSGELIFEEQATNNELLEKIYSYTTSKNMTKQLRKFVIDNEVTFCNDYHRLLRDLFNLVSEKPLEDSKLRMALLTIAEGMYKHQFVMDPEINCYACLISLSEILSGKS